MKTIRQYKEDIKALMDRSGQFDAKAEAESRDLNAQELALKNEILDTVEELREQVRTLERQDRVHQSLEVPAGETRKAAKTVTPGIVVGEDRASKDRFASFGQQLAAVRNACQPQGHVDPRLYNAVSTGLTETVPSDGGFLVQTDFATELLDQVWATGVLPSLCREIPISAPSNKLTMNGVDESSRATGSRGGGIRGYWVSQGSEKTQSKPKFRQINLELRKLVGLCDATDEMLADAVALEGIIRTGFAKEFGFLLDDAILNGSGADQPLGILQSPALVTQAKEDGQDADTIVVENVVKMYARMFASSMGDARWLINQTVLPQLFTMSLPVGLGGVPVYMPPAGVSAAPYGTLYGRPVLAVEQCQALGDAGDIILCDFASGYLLATKGGMKSDVSIHVRFEFDESVFRFVLRVDGQPLRASAMTPYKGGATATQNHFVTLAARA
ncbi:MAG: phage major capsid protein [Planctomycetota bacterium]